jgi:hypothetical protein
MPKGYDCRSWAIITSHLQRVLFQSYRIFDASCQMGVDGQRGKEQWRGEDKSFLTLPSFGRAIYLL